MLTVAGSLSAVRFALFDTSMLVKALFALKSSVVRPVQSEASRVVTELGTVRLVNPVQSDTSRLVRLVQSETFSDVTLLGTVRLVRPVQPETSSVVRLVQAERSRLVRPEPETFNVVTLAGKVRPVRLVQPDSSSVCKLFHPVRFSAVKPVVHPFALSVLREFLPEPKPAPDVVIWLVVSFVPEMSSSSMPLQSLKASVSIVVKFPQPEKLIILGFS